MTCLLSYGDLEWELNSVLDGSIGFAIFVVQNLDSIGRPDPCVITQPSVSLLGGGSQSKYRSQND